MFKVTVLTQNLKTAVSLASHAVSNRSQLPILLNFLLETKGGELYISATDLEIGIKIKTPAKIEKEGQVCVMAKTFLDLISNIDQEKITLTQEEKILILEGNKIKTRFPTTPPEDFPALYKQRGEKQAEFKKEEFDRLVQRIVFSSAQDLGRPALSGVLIKGEGEKLTIVATDGYRLSLNQGILEAKKGSGESLLVPARVIREVVGLKQGGKTIVLYTSKENNQVLFEYEDAIVVGRLIEAEYPDYQRIIPDDSSTRAVFDKNLAQGAVRACSVFAREAANIVKLSVGKDKIVFSSSASSVGENEVEVEAKVEGEENEIAFNARYLLEFLGSIDDEEVFFEMTGPLNPGVFKLPKDPDYLHIIMPIRVQG